MRPKDKQKAISLRIEGKSYREIRAKISNLSKSTLSGWLKNIQLTHEQNEKLRNNLKKINYNARVKSAWTKRKDKQERIKKILIDSESESLLFLKNPLFIIVLFLYWAEGSKTQELVQFSNSDPRLIKIMMKWFIEVCKIPRSKIKVHIYIHKIYKKENCEDFWSKITNVPVSKFGKTTYKPTPHKIKKNIHYKGVCRLDICSVNFFWKIMGWQHGILKTLNLK
jgi:hypothetical protein